MIDLEKVAVLTEGERERAFELARERVAGKVPTLQAEKKGLISEYPPGVQVLIIVLCLCLLLFALIPSALRLYVAGSSTFCEKVQLGGITCDAAGVSTIFTAELGQILFLLTVGVFGRTNTTKRIFYGGAFLATAIALIGNLHIAQPWATGMVFSWVESLAPPVLVMGVGYAFKELLLTALRGHVSAAQAYNRKLEERHTIFEDPTAQASWLRYYSTALKKVILLAHPELESAGLRAGDFAYLIKREMNQDQFVVNPDEQTAQEVREEVREKEAELTQDVIEVDGGVLYKTTTGWGARSNLSRKTLRLDYKTDKSAHTALKLHNHAHVKPRIVKRA